MLTLRYMFVVALAVPATQTVAAVVLGPSLGWASVAIGRALGYPFAFAALAYIALSRIDLSIARWLAAAAGPHARRSSDPRAHRSMPYTARVTVDELRASIERVFVDVPTSELPMPSTHPPNAPALVSWFVSDEAAVIEIFAKWPRSRRELTVAHVTSHGDLGEAMQRRVDELVAYVRECRHDAFPLRASVVHDDARLHELVARTRAPIAHDDPDFSTRYNAREALLDELGRELSPRVARYLLEIVDDSNAACWLSDHGVIEVRPWLVTALASADAFTVAFRARQLAHLDAWRATTRGFGIALDASVVG